MTKQSDGFVRATSRAKYNEGYMPGFGNDFETEPANSAIELQPRRTEIGVPGLKQVVVVPE